MMGRLWSSLSSQHTETALEVLTWEMCAKCRGLAAVGRERIGPRVDVRFDCSAQYRVPPGVVSGTFSARRSGISV